MSQRSRTPGPEVVRVTTRARLAHIERNQSSIWAAIRQLQAQNDIVTSDQWLPSQEENTERQSVASHLDRADNMDDDTNTSEDLSPPNAPAHLIQLFENGLIDSDSHNVERGMPAQSNSSTTPQDMQACATLRALCPSRADMTIIAAHASSWLPLYTSMFPVVNVIMTPEAMLALHDELQSRDDRMALASLLLYIAITVHHAPATACFSSSENMQILPAFVQDVSDAVERTVIADDVLAKSIEGIEVALLFLRL
jgi:DNA-binding transcriptional ArsR family regulator